MSSVFVVDTSQRILDPIHPGTARWLLSHRKAAVWRRFPFTIILRRVVPEAEPQSLRVKIDPDSRTTGLAVVNDGTGHVVWAGELLHRGQLVKARLGLRRDVRRSRRRRHTRYRPARSDNRRRAKGWLPPSLESRLCNVLTWVERLRRVAPIGAISQELVRFDTQLLEHPAIRGTEYQQGNLAGYEVREYLLEKWERTCAYCGALNVPLQVEHIVLKARGGTNRVSNLAVACEPCNTAKGTKTADEFGYPHVQAHALRPLRDAAVINATRWALYQRLQTTGLPVEGGTGGRTKWNRTCRELPKLHWMDAACVGASTPAILHVSEVKPLGITATGHGNRQMCGTDKHGFPIRHRTRRKRYFEFQTGDIVQALVTTGARTGSYVGRVAVRARGSFDIRTTTGTITGVAARYCRQIHRSDGYAYGY